MIGIVITGHGSFPTGILESLTLITGNNPQIEAVPFTDNHHHLEGELDKAIQHVNTGDGVICFADLAGGTPFNICSRIASASNDIEVVGGANIPMILSGLFKRELPMADFIDYVIREGKTNIKQFNVPAVKHDEESDGI